MEEPVSPLVLTKLRAPATRARLISRPRLIGLLATENGASFVLVCAPAGYGKTTLLAEWAQSLMKNGTAVAWYALDPSDDDPIPFKSYLIASFIHALGPNTELAQIAQLLRSSPEMDFSRILPAVINAIISCERECVLILDDYHLIEAPAIHNALAYLLEHLPENLRIAVGSRSDPPLPLARLRARGQLLEIRAAGLRFTIDETAQFLNEVMQLELSVQGISVLEERTEGWVAGLQLAALSLSASADKEQVIASFTGSHRYLVEYLMEEVVNRQPEEAQSFLLATSILERLCAPLCDALLVDKLEGLQVEKLPSTFEPSNVRTCQQILEYLEHANLFLVPLDDERIWYRYHHLFRDFLQTRLNKTQPERINALHRAACEWLAAQGFLREAAGHAFQIHDWEHAAAFVEQHSFTLIIHSDISTIYEWCSAFPEEVMQRHPMLCLLQSLALAYGFRRLNRARIEARLQQVDRLILTLEDRQIARGLTDMAGVVRTFLAMAPDPAADPQELLALAQNMLGAYPEGDAGQFSGLLLTGYAYLALHEAQAAEHAFETARPIARRERMYFGVVESTFHLARLAHSQGQLRRAVEICRQGQADIAAVLAHPERELPALGCLDVALGCVLLEQDRLDEAEGHLRHGLELMGGGMNPYYLMTACVALFRLCEIRGRPAEAMKYLDRLEAAWPDMAFCTQGLRVRHALRIASEDPGVLADASAWCQRFASSIDNDAFLPGIGPFGAAEAYYLAYLAWVRAQIALGKAQEVMSTLARQLDLASAHGLTNRVIELSLLEAQSWRAESEDQRARAALKRALAVARPAGYVRIFDQGAALARLLVEAAQHGISREYIERILAAIGMPEVLDLGRRGSMARSARALYGERLSERELEVLRLIARGATNQEIADQLVIAVGTVKSHINHVLGKLDAHNRTEAVARARGLGLLDI
ncbi:MAG: LuxR C-terminal-related transcriptional regulator [Anaerolineales bacterium]|nr:LuxR C-terminal-related transcriptional regulator [Anaerolineales bacterium]